MPTTLFPRDAETPGDIKGFIRDGEVFFVGDRVMLTHRPSKSRLFGTLGGVYATDRGFLVRGVPFLPDGVAYFPTLGYPGDEIYGLTLVERGDTAIAVAKAHYEAWENYSDLAREGYLSALAMDGKL